MLKLTLKDTSFNWSTTCQKAFELLKKSIIIVFVLRHFDRFKQIVLETNSSNYVNDEVLSQYDDEENLHLVAFYSKNLLLTKCNYEIYDKKLLAIVRCLERWRPNLETIDISIKMFTNHKNLKYFITSKKLTCR
jgi:hypothetical protein